MRSGQLCDSISHTVHEDRFGCQGCSYLWSLSLQVHSSVKSNNNPRLYLVMKIVVCFHHFQVPYYMYIFFSYLQYMRTDNSKVSGLSSTHYKHFAMVSLSLIRHQKHQSNPLVVGGPCRRVLDSIQIISNEKATGSLGWGMREAANNSHRSPHSRSRDPFIGVPQLR